MIFENAEDWPRFRELAWRAQDGVVTPSEKRELRELVGQISPGMAWDLDWEGVLRLVRLTMGVYAIAHADEVAVP